METQKSNKEQIGFTNKRSITYRTIRFQPEPIKCIKGTNKTNLPDMENKLSMIHHNNNNDLQEFSLDIESHPKKVQSNNPKTHYPILEVD